MPRRAEFIFYPGREATTLSVPTKFQCPEGLNSFSIVWWRSPVCYNKQFQCPEGLNSFSIAVKNALRALPIIMFQCPEGLNSFSIKYFHVRVDQRGMVSMPRRAEFIFYRCLHSCGMERQRHSFQCPEGLNSFSICKIYGYYSILFWCQPIYGINIAFRATHSV